MARTRREIDSEQKRAEIIAAARRLFLSEGYDAAGMARIAAEAGVAPNTLYWYFKDKDELLIAMLNELVAEALSEYQTVQGQALDAQLMWLLGKFDAVPGLINTVHSRLQLSPVINDWHSRFHQMVESMVALKLGASRVPEAQRLTAARIAMFVVEGLLSHHAGDPAERGAIVSLLVAPLAADL